MSCREDYVFAVSDRMPYDGCTGRNVKECATKDLEAVVRKLKGSPPTRTPEREALRIRALDMATAEIAHRKALEQQGKMRLPISFLETWTSTDKETESKFKGVGWYALDEASYIMEGPFETPEEAAFSAGRYWGVHLDKKEISSEKG